MTLSYDAGAVHQPLGQRASEPQPTQLLRNWGVRPWLRSACICVTRSPRNEHVGPSFAEFRTDSASEQLLLDAMQLRDLLPDNPVYAFVPAYAPADQPQPI